MSKVEKRLFWPLISERSSCQSSFGIFRKTSTTVGSTAVPEQREFLRAPHQSCALGKAGRW